MNKPEWKEPATSTIRLLDGEEVQAEVNGKSPDGLSGFAMVNGEEIKVTRYRGEWSEDPFLDEADLP